MDGVTSDCTHAAKQASNWIGSSWLKTRPKVSCGSSRKVSSQACFWWPKNSTSAPLSAPQMTDRVAIRRMAAGDRSTAVSRETKGIGAGSAMKGVSSVQRCHPILPMAGTAPMGMRLPWLCRLVVERLALCPLQSREGLRDASPRPKSQCIQLEGSTTNTMLEELRRFDALRDGDTGKDKLLTGSLDALAPVYADNSVFDSLSTEVAEHLHHNGIASFYQHQAEAVLKALSGANVVLQAPTASGKTLGFQVPMVETLVREPDAHALMIYPTKALAYDQRDQFQRIFGALRDSWGQPIGSWWYDGDVDRETRKAIRSAPPHILLTNPEMVHNSFLAHAGIWDTFLSNLKYVVIDEMHEYRGYFGSNVSLVLRRLVHHLHQRGVSPQFFLASATCANAKEHAENLTGLAFEEVNASDQFRPERRFYFVKPDIPQHRYWDVLRLRTVRAGLASMENDKSVLVFCPTRKFAEECFRLAQHEVSRLQEQDQCTVEPGAIRVYRAGLASEERQQTQEDLRNGTVRLVFTTNALELGIDIGNLDGVILAGFPDSIMSAWQRIGRAGRSWDSDAFVIYYARNNPLDSSMLRTSTRSLKNRSTSSWSIRKMRNWCAAMCLVSSMKPKSIEGGESRLGSGLYEAAREHVQRGAQPVRTRGYSPHFGVDIRGTGGGMYTLKLGSRDLGTMSAQQQFREAYQRAIYMHGGTNYRVESIETTSNGGTIHLGEAPPTTSGPIRSF